MILCPIPPRDPPSLPLAAARTFARGIDHAEGVLWLGEEQLLAGGERGQIYRVDVRRDRYAEIANTGGILLGFARRGDGLIFACDEERRAVFALAPTGALRVFADRVGDRPLACPNYPVLDAAGHLYVTDSGRWEGGDGALLRFAPDGRGQVVSTACRHFPNGACWSADHRYLYVVESNLPGVVRIDPEGGARRIEVRFDAGVPDGLWALPDGDVLISFYTPSLVLRWTPVSGRLTCLCHEPENTFMCAPTNVTVAPDGRLFTANLGAPFLTEWNAAAALAAPNGGGA